MALSQTALDRLARHGTKMLGGLLETVTYHAKASATAAVVNHAGLEVSMEFYRGHEIDGEQILKEDRQCRIRTALVTWTPTVFDTFTRPDGTLWLVMGHREGTNRPFYLLQTRQTG